MMIDMHAHWKPAEVADALRARTREPRIVRGADGVEVLKAPRMGELRWPRRSMKPWWNWRAWTGRMFR